jgi:dUTP pyrophosphatase
MPDSPQLYVCIEAPHCMPSRGTELSAGLDLKALESVMIPPHGRVIVSTGIMVTLPINCYGRIAPRSGLAVFHGIDVMAGVVDADYL